MKRYMCIVSVPAVFYAYAEDDAAAEALSEEALEDFAFDQLGKYVEVDLRQGQFDNVTVCEGEELDAEDAYPNRHLTDSA